MVNMKKLKKALKVFWETIVINEVDSKPFRKSIFAFYRLEDSFIYTTFTSVRVFDEGCKFVVEITSHRPGLVIGRQGSFITALEEYLNTENFSKPVEVNIKESKLWHNLYN